MATTTTVLRISPMLAVADMEATLQFYQAILGFSIMMQSPAYSIAQRDGLTIHFQRAADEEVLRSMRGHSEFYIEVRGIRALWETVKAHKDRFRIRDLFEREYGMTEFHIVDPSGVLIFVGEATAGMAG